MLCSGSDRSGLPSLAKALAIYRMERQNRNPESRTKRQKRAFSILCQFPQVLWPRLLQSQRLDYISSGDWRTRLGEKARG